MKRSLLLNCHFLPKRARVLWIGVFFVGLCIGGTAQCAQQPLVEVPKAFKNAAPGDPALPPPTEAWWRVFRDPALDALETPALAANQDLAQAIARITEAREQARIVAADFYPHVGLDFGASRLRTTNSGPVQQARLVGAAAPTVMTSQLVSSFYNDYRTPIDISYELDIFGRIRHSYGSAHAIWQAAEADRRAVALSLSAEVATNYFGLRALDLGIDVLHRAVALRHDSVQLNQERITAGLANSIDLSRACVELENTQAELDDAVRLRAEAENNLAALCGQPASDFRFPARSLENLAPPAVPAGVPAGLMARRPDLAEAERRLAAANEQIGVAHAQLLPTFSIGASVGYESGKEAQLVESQSRALALMGTVSIPIFEGGRNAANLRAARARRDEALAAYRATAITAFKEVENALADLRQRTAQLAAHDRAVVDAKEVLELSQKRYIQGSVSYFEVVDAQRSLLKVELDRVQTLNARFAATVALVRALGGGW